MEQSSTGHSFPDHNVTDEKERKIQASLSKIKNKFIVMSGKGGVGKTSVSANLAIALANKGYQVGLMDVDIHGPDVPRMLGLNQRAMTTDNENLKPVHYNENLGVISIESLSQNRDEALIWRGPMKYKVIRQFIGDVEWGGLDFLIIDAPPGTGDEPLTVCQTITDAKAIIVTTPQEVALADVRKSINFCKTIKISIFGIVENMSGFSCPHCSQTITLFGPGGGGEKTAQLTQIESLGKIPFDLRMVLCGDSGASYQKAYADSEVAQAFSGIADKMIETRRV
ncbi:MAG: Mrp/NBP35 family ATP-binding protein [Deltaproteobacteria bacterium]|jgi:ATP-binding protein involved in chromosome partitioning|nr:Mrp/NBP35 family ATP-binding protein [Deltaproteobacteria bacterium]MBT4090450.1 Mrp/NBP35 family ATP-binding protein [Deltaproteobacteria bacterium]MBT4263774.1 Mrp/NBP35 family ATP-binding protein [Deltaproteobacteria bacterium]MBT4643327.1 Mrp/NBP35 family ATP-binding protein [Deltaproteobacteria bacterium]MBT6498694.1 Mrp/NBP35 family ATP-binding protein [Deltaproteobacteria bacterium]